MCADNVADKMLIDFFKSVYEYMLDSVVCQAIAHISRDVVILVDWGKGGQSADFINSQPVMDAASCHDKAFSI
jgi:hypothetical protein